MRHASSPLPRVLLSATCAFLMLAQPAATSLVRAQSGPPAKPPAAAELDRARLEVIEELSESLANDLLELSVATRDRDLRKTAEFIPAEFQATPLPVAPQPLKVSVKWIAARAWA
ncbi:MAG: hypothetical protein M3416_07655, partial [Acidobacteriota bacterium]|nr:hypothetical protein [Acidobacteriota bacterium]